MKRTRPDTPDLCHPGEAAELKRLTVSPAPRLREVRADSVALGSFLGTWRAAGLGVHRALTSFPRYCLAGLPVGYQFKNITDADVNNLLLEDLIIWTNYEIEVAAYNSAGLGVYSSKVTEWTLQGGGYRPWPRGQMHPFPQAQPLPGPPPVQARAPQACFSQALAIARGWIGPCVQLLQGGQLGGRGGGGQRGTWGREVASKAQGPLQSLA